MNPVEYRVAAGVEATALASRVELASGRERREQLVSMRVQTLGVLIPLGGSRTLALRYSGGHAAGDRCPPSILEDGGQSQDLAGTHGRLRVMGPQISVLCEQRKSQIDEILRVYVKFLPDLIPEIFPLARARLQSRRRV